MDPYATLGVRKNASKAAIKNAYRMKSKTAHPDGGGSAEKFGALNVAYKVLSDDERRAKYDATGEIGGDGPDNSQQRAWNIIATLLDQIINSPQDVEAADLVADMSRTLKQQIDNNEKNIKTVKKAREKVEAVAARFKVKKGNNMIAAMLKAKIASFDVTLRSADIVQADNRLALDMLKNYEFDKKAVKQAPLPSFHQVFGFAQTGSSA